MLTHTNCDGIRRRDFLKVGALTGLGLSLPEFLQLAEAGGIRRSAKATNAIFINLQGGPSHMDTFDLKPTAPQEYRGQFNPIDTNVSGIQISEHLPQLAQVADKYAILRGVSHTLAAHALGTQYVNTGNRPLPSLEYPGYGAVISKEMPTDPQLPSSVAVPKTAQTTGYLGLQYGPLTTGSQPKAGQPYSVRGMRLPSGLTVKDVKNRQNLLRDLDQTFADYESQDPLLRGLDRFSQQAYGMILSDRARKAFDISGESPSAAKPFGDSPFGQSCLLACRLVEAGVRFVTISSGGWDTHKDNFPKLKETNLPPLDTGLSALLLALADRGLLESTVVFVTGEFGRTPKINPRSGRDHWPRAMFMLLAGGGIRGGQVLGASDEKGAGPANDGFSPDDVAATFYHTLGINPHKEYHTDTGRPVMIVRNGQIIQPLFG